MSLTVVLEGTSRRGHFICRYCTGDRKHKAAGETRPRVPTESRGGTLLLSYWRVRDVTHCNCTCSLLGSVQVVIRGRAHVCNPHCHHQPPHHFGGGHTTPQVTKVFKELIGEGQVLPTTVMGQAGITKGAKAPRWQSCPIHFRPLTAARTCSPKK